MNQHSKMAAPSLAARLSMTWPLSRLRAMPSSPTVMMPVWMMSRIRYIPEIYLGEIKLYEPLLKVGSVSNIRLSVSEGNIRARLAHYMKK